MGALSTFSVPDLISCPWRANARLRFDGPFQSEPETLVFADETGPAQRAPPMRIAERAAGDRAELHSSCLKSGLFLALSCPATLLQGEICASAHQEPIERSYGDRRCFQLAHSPPLA